MAENKHANLTQGEILFDCYQELLPHYQIENIQMLPLLDKETETSKTVFFFNNKGFGKCTIPDANKQGKRSFFIQKDQMTNCQSNHSNEVIENLEEKIWTGIETLEDKNSKHILNKLPSIFRASQFKEIPEERLKLNNCQICFLMHSSNEVSKDFFQSISARIGMAIEDLPVAFKKRIDMNPKTKISNKEYLSSLEKCEGLSLINIQDKIDKAREQILSFSKDWKAHQKASPGTAK